MKKTFVCTWNRCNISSMFIILVWIRDGPASDPVFRAYLEYEFRWITEN